jgi:hypothetical protein
MAKRTTTTTMGEASAAAAKGATLPQQDTPQQDFLTPEEAEVSVAGATATLVKSADGRKILHVQVPLEFAALRCRVAAKGEKAPTSAYLPFQARLDVPKGVRVGGNIHVPFALLHAATIANAVENWKAAQVKAKAQREKAAEEDREKLG